MPATSPRLDGLDNALDSAGDGLGGIGLNGDIHAEARRAGGVLKVGDVEIGAVGDLGIEVATDIRVHRSERGGALGGDDIETAASVQLRLVSCGEGFGLVEAGR